MEIKVYLLNAFGISDKGGNPAGVVLNAENLNDDQKKEIASLIGFSETAFVERPEKADYKVTFFTPTDEVDLCGHATIATYSLMFQKGLLGKGTFTQELKAGILKIEIKEDGLILMEQTLPIFSELIDLTEIRKIIPDYEEVIGLKSQIVSTGIRDIMLPIKDRKSLFELSPNFEEMKKLNKITNSVGMHVFTLDTIDRDSIAHCRNFAPLYGITEESATGSSNGALACYLFKNNVLKKFSNLIFEQGYSMGKPSEITVSLDVEGDAIKEIEVGGKAILNGEKKIQL